MDVRFYPSAGGTLIPGDPSNLDFTHCLGYYNYDKFGNKNDYMAEANGALLSAGDTFYTPSLGDEEFEIPPITPPPEAGPEVSDSGSPFSCLPEPPPSHRGPFTPLFPPQRLELPSITLSQEDPVLSSGQAMTIRQAHLRQYHPGHSDIMRCVVTMSGPSAAMSGNQLSTVNQSQLSARPGPNVNGPNVPHASPSPPASKSATPSPSGSVTEEDADDGSRVTGEKRPAPDAGRKPKTPKKKKKKDPNEPQKPVSAYALFFRDTQAAIKGQNASATFGEVSKIVASMWDGLGDEQKQVYKSKTEAAKKEYLKALAAYRASLVSRAAAETAEAQTIRSVQQALVSADLPPSLMLAPPLSQLATMSSAAAQAQALQQALPRSIAPKPFHARLLGQAVVSATEAPQSCLPSGVPSQLMGQMGGGALGAGQRMSPPMQPAQRHQLLQQQHMQQSMQHPHFHQHLQQQMQHQQHMQQMQLQHMRLHPSRCSPSQHSPGAPQPVSRGSPQPAPLQQHPSQIQAHAQAHAQALSQVSIY